MTSLGIDAEFIGADRQAADALRTAFAAAGIRITGTTASIDEMLARPQTGCPHVLVLDLSACPGEPAATVRQLRGHCQQSVIIVTGNEASASTISKAVAAGARGFLLRPYEPDDLVTTIQDAYETARAYGNVRAGRGTSRAGRLLCVYSPKGGVGCTTIATNLAVALANRGASVALVDLALQFGDVGSVLDLRSMNSIVELLGQNQITDELVNEGLVLHSSGVRVLLAPNDLAVVETIDPEEVVTLVEKLAGRFDYVICDLWSSLEELSMQVMEAADRVLLVATPELPALHSVQRVVVATRDRLRLDERAIFIGNRIPGKAGLSVTDISGAFGREFAVMIPSEGVGVTEAINRGLSFFDPRVNPRIAKHYKHLADVVVNSLQQAPAAPARV